MSVTHTFVNPKPDGTDATVTRPSDWNAAHTVSIANVDVANAAAIVESKLALNFATHAAVTLDANADTLLSLSTQALGLDTQLANKIFAGATSGGAAVPAFRSLVAADIPILTPAYIGNGTIQYQVLTTGATPFAPVYSDFYLKGTTGGSTNFAVTNTKTLTLTSTDNYTITVPASLTLAGRDVANTFTAAQTVNAKITISQATAGQDALAINHTNANAYGIYINLSNQTPNATNYLFRADTAGVPKFTVYSDGSGFLTGVLTIANNPIIGGFTLTVPATGTAALLGTANIFSADQAIQRAVDTTLKIEATAASKYAQLEVKNTSGDWSFFVDPTTGNVDFRDITNERYPFLIKLNGQNNTFVVDTGGKVAIGDWSPPVAPISKLHVYGVGNVPSLSADYQIFTIGNTTTQDLGIGANPNSPYDMWLQVKSQYNYGAAFPISLQPLGGGVIMNESGAADGDFRAESDTEADMIFLDASADTLQLGGTTNSTTIAKGGRLTMTGTARVNRSVILATGILGSGGASPALAKVGNTAGYKYAVSDEVYLVPFEIPYDWDSTTDLIFKVHFYSTNTTASRFVKFQIDYNATAEGTENVNAATTTANTGDITLSTTAYRLTEATATLAVANFAPDDLLSFLIKRIASVGTAPTAPADNPVVMSFEIEYISNKLGE